MDLFDIVAGRQGGGAGGGKLPIGLVERIEYLEATASPDPTSSLDSINSFVDLKILKTSLNLIHIVLSIIYKDNYYQYNYKN